MYEISVSGGPLGPDSVSQAMKYHRVHKANVRASETPVQTMNRQEHKSRNYHVVAYSILAEGLHFSALVYL